MKIAYFDCAVGVSGDMILGALVDYGVKLNAIERELKRLSLSYYKLSAKRIRAGHITATRVEVKTESRLSADEMEKIIKDSTLSEEIKEGSLRILERIFEAERVVHREGEVHLHELGSADTIIDIVGVLWGLKLAGIEEIYSSPLNLGSPAPATLELTKGYSVKVGGSLELTTPTGAAIVTTLSSGWNMPEMVLLGAGFGAGNYEMAEPDLLKMIVGEKALQDEIVLLETNIDDLSPQIAGYVMERLFECGALDVWFTPIYMKKNRPAIMLSCLVRRERERCVTDCIFSETTTVGIRRQAVERSILEREKTRVKTEYGDISAKRVFTPSGERMVFEYEDLVRIAKKKEVSLLKLLESIKP